MKMQLYYCLAEIYLDSGIVSNSRWFKVLNQVFIKLMKINVAIVTEDHLFIYQDIDPSVQYISCAIIFDRSNFTPLKKFDFSDFFYLSYNYFYVNQKYRGRNENTDKFFQKYRQKFSKISTKIFKNIDKNFQKYRQIFSKISWIKILL